MENRRMLLQSVVWTALIYLIIASHKKFNLKSTLTDSVPVQSLQLKYQTQNQISSQGEIKVNSIHGTKEKMITLAKLIHKSKIHVRGLKTSGHLKEALNVIKLILKDMNINDEDLFERSSVKSKHICPETFKGGAFGFPFYHKGFEVDHCDYDVPLSKLVTVIHYINAKQIDWKSEIDKFAASVHKTFKDMKVLIAINSEKKYIQFDDNYTNTKFFPSEYKSEGFALNTVVREVKTPYVLIARGVEFFTNDSRLERLVRELESLNVFAVGGAFSYPNGHWYKGCFQSVHKNYVLKYIEGYDESFHECLYCDYIQGPFLTSTKFLNSNKFGDFDENNGLFEDFFLRISKMKEETIVCPDSMFNIKSKEGVQPDPMIGFLQKWEVSEIVTSEGRIINRPCNILISGKKSFALSPCSLRVNNAAVNTVMQICHEVGITCELRDGTALGAVKFGNTLPWELDFDIGVSFNNCSKCKQLEQSFLNINVKFNHFATICCTKDIDYEDELFFRLRVRGYRGDFISYFFGHSDELPTKVPFGGQWLNIARNPGLYMRNRYGKEIYKHAEHWYYTGIKETKGNKVNYSSGRFHSCEVPGAHNCLDGFNADGNLQFIELFP